MNILIHRFKHFCELVDAVFQLWLETLRTTFRRPFLWQEFMNQVYQLGNKSFALSTLTSLSIGAVMTLQFGWGLSKFGGKLYIPKVIGVSVVLELAPVFTALVVASRVGSGIASELGSMAVTQQIDAIRALGTDPIQRLVVPRFWALFICVPFLTVIAIAVGIFSGMVIGAVELDITKDFFISKALSGITYKEVTIGLGKTFFFGMFIALIACYRGLETRGGTRGVGESTTWTVVMTISLILVADVFLTKMLMLLVGK